MLRAGHIYPEDITALVQKNEQQYVMCYCKDITVKTLSLMSMR